MEANAKPDWTSIRKQLEKPWKSSLVQWRPGAVSRDKKRAQALAFVDPREYARRLDTVVGGDWHVDFEPWGEQRVICRVTIHGVTRASTGEFDASDHIAKGTTAEAQAFKRACVMFGLGRYLYDIPLVWVGYDEKRRVLTETPELSGKFAPDNNPSQQDAVSITIEEKKTPKKPASPRLTSERAEKAVKLLRTKGLVGEEMLQFASQVLGKKVGGFMQLTEAEALEVWAVAKERPTQDEPFKRASVSTGKDEAEAPVSVELEDLEEGARGRAVAIIGELSRLGFRGNIQLEFASDILGRKVESFTELTDEESVKVWQEARKHSKLDFPEIDEMINLAMSRGFRSDREIMAEIHRVIPGDWVQLSELTTGQIRAAQSHFRSGRFADT